MHPDHKNQIVISGYQFWSDLAKALALNVVDGELVNVRVEDCNLTLPYNISSIITTYYKGSYKLFDILAKNSCIHNCIFTFLPGNNSCAVKIEGKYPNGK